jgi:hypothetical protein
VNYLKGKNLLWALSLGCTPPPNPAKSSDLNIMPGDKVRLLIPEALGGGTIIGTYRDYGRIETSAGAVHDVYELLALWNSPTLRSILKECNPFYRFKWCIEVLQKHLNVAFNS